MRNLFLLAGAGVMLALGVPAAADAKPGKGKAGAAKVHLNAKGQIDVNRNGIADWRERRMIDANANGILDWRERKTVDINRNGIADWRERWIDRDRDGIDDRQEAMGRRWGMEPCPPGLAKKTPACWPPGQVGKQGGPVPAGWDYINYSSIPVSIRDRYDLDDDYRYIYRNNRLYVVDPTEPLIIRILNAIRF